MNGPSPVPRNRPQPDRSFGPRTSLGRRSSFRDVNRAYPFGSRGATSATSSAAPHPFVTASKRGVSPSKCSIPDRLLVDMWLWASLRHPIAVVRPARRPSAITFRVVGGKAPPRKTRSVKKTGPALRPSGGRPPVGPKQRRIVTHAVSHVSGFARKTSRALGIAWYPASADLALLSLYVDGV